MEWQSTHEEFTGDQKNMPVLRGAGDLKSPFQCPVCLKAPPPTKSRCSRCLFIRYCNREHQEQHWNLRHRRECKRISQIDSLASNPDIVKAFIFNRLSLIHRRLSRNPKAVMVGIFVPEAIDLYTILKYPQTRLPDGTILLSESLDEYRRSKADRKEWTPRVCVTPGLKSITVVLGLNTSYNIPGKVTVRSMFHFDVDVPIPKSLERFMALYTAKEEDRVQEKLEAGNFTVE